MYDVKNQNKIKEGHKADCSLYSLFTILELNYGLKFKYGLIEKVSKYAVIDKVLLKFGAYFGIIYPWFTRIINKKLGLNIGVEKLNINSILFKNLVKQGDYFGIGLKYGNKPYLNAVKRRVLTRKDIDLIKEKKGGFGHNNVYGLYNDRGFIFEIYKGKKVRCSMEVLKYGVEQGVFYTSARTIIENDKFTESVSKIIKIHRDNPNKDLKDEGYTNDELNKAFELLKKYKFYNKYTIKKGK